MTAACADGLWKPDNAPGDTVNAPVEGGIVFTDVILQHPVELGKGRDGINVQGVKPSFLEGAEMPFHLAFFM